MHSQTEIVRKHLRRHNSITPAQAWSKYGITRLAARIYDLNKEGFSTVTCMVSSRGRRFAKYLQG